MIVCLVRLAKSGRERTRRLRSFDLDKDQWPLKVTYLVEGVHVRVAFHSVRTCSRRWKKLS